MKKVVVLAIFVLISLIGFSQKNMPVDKSGKITYKEVFNVAITTDQSVQILRNYVDTSMFFQSDKNENNINEREGNIIKYSGRIRTYYNEKRALLAENPTSNKGTWMKDVWKEWGYVSFELSFLVEEGKVGYKFTNFEHKHDTELGSGFLEQDLGQNTKQFYWDEYKNQVNRYVLQMTKEIKGLFKDKGLIEEW